MMNKKTSAASNEMGLKEVIVSLREWVLYLRSKWFVLLLVVLTGGIVGALYSFFSAPQYIAKTTFVLDENDQSNPLGTLAGLSMLGVNTNADENLFSGDNLTWLYTSDRMIGETLMTEADSMGKKKLLINWFIDIDKSIRKIIKTVKEKNPAYKGIPENIEKKDLSLDQKRVLNKAIKIIRNDYLTVAMEDKTTGIIGVSMISKNELFSDQFVNKIVARVNEFYIATKTKKMSDQVAALQKKVDEFNKNMNTSMYQAAGAADAVPNPNPGIQTLRVAPQRKVVDVQVNSAIYTAMVQQLEAAKVTLAKEAPLIQIVDAPTLPLELKKPGLVKCAVIGTFVFFVLGITAFISKRYYRNIMSEQVVLT